MEKIIIILVFYTAMTNTTNILDSSPSSSPMQRFTLLVDDVIQRDATNHTLLCPNLASLRPYFKKEPQQWQPVKGKKLLVFSAFYERREVADGPAIRIIASGFQERFNKVGQHYCQFWYESIPFPVSVGPAIYYVIYPSLAHGDMWVSHFVICKLPQGNFTNTTPYAVSVVGRRCEEPSNTLMVLNRDDVKVQDTHALCISPMYGHFNQWELLMEQIELQKLLGAAEITLYNFSISSTTSKVIHKYVTDSTENINVIRWPFPGVKSNVFCQRGALNDCLYRMGHRHRYVTITDMDEILVPRKELTWTALIKRLHAMDPQIGSFLFQHAYFRRNTTIKSLPLVTQTSFWRTDEVTPPGKIRCKAMYECSKAVSIDLHFAYYLTPGAKELILDPDDGMLHHYRPYPMETFIKYPERFNYMEDRFMLRYGVNLSQAVAKKRHEIFVNL